MKQHVVLLKENGTSYKNIVVTKVIAKIYEYGNITKGKTNLSRHTIRQGCKQSERLATILFGGEPIMSIITFNCKGIPTRTTLNIGG